MSDRTPFPEKGTPGAELLAELDEMRVGDADWRSGRTFSLVYHPDDDDLEHTLEQVAIRFLHENALNPFKFPSLLKMENDIAYWAADLLNAEPGYGKLTSGGTESIFLALQTARDHARRVLGIAEPRFITPITAHPAFAKAAHYLDIEQVRVPVEPDGRVAPDTVAAALTDDTALIVGSAPCYPFGTIDPIPELAALAAEREILCHVDACLGGFLLPFLERNGVDLPPWDFRVEGVTSVSADVHKYGYAFKGASTVTYRDKPVLEQQYFLYDDWPGGLYGSATTAGTRSAAPIAGAWGALRSLGDDGYRRLARQVHDAFTRFIGGIESIDGVDMIIQPDAGCFEFGSRDHDIFAIGDVMDDRGWHLDRQDGGLHVIVFPFHANVIDDFVTDLTAAVADHGESRGTKAVYGAVGD